VTSGHARATSAILQPSTAGVSPISSLHRTFGFARLTSRVSDSAMIGVVRFERPVASRKVVASLVTLGYLQRAKRHRVEAIEGAIERLRSDLYSAGGAA
jgi:hypothetical protein